MMAQQRGAMEYIRQQYRVPAKRGARVFFSYINKECTVSSARGHLLVITDSDRKRYLVHPTWQLTYLPTKGASA